MKGNERIVSVSFLHPLHAITGIGKNLFDGTTGGLVGLRVKGESRGELRFLRTPGGILRKKVLVGLVQVDEVDRAKGAVGLHFANDTAQAVAVVGVVLAVESHAIVAEGEELTALGYVPTDALVHDSNEIMGGFIAIFLLETVRNLQLREQDAGRCPGVAVLRRLQHGARGRNMLVAGVTEIVQVEASLPVGHHWLMVVSPVVVAQF